MGLLVHKKKSWYLRYADPSEVLLNSRGVSTRHSSESLRASPLLGGSNQLPFHVNVLPNDRPVQYLRVDLGPNRVNVSGFG